VELRKARGRDLESLERIERSSFHEERFQRWLLQSMIGEKGFMTLVAVDEGEVVGYGSIHLPGPGPARIISVAVLPERRGAGIGRSILEAMEAECARMGVSSLCLEVAISNLVALHLYVSKGYEVKGTIPGYYGEGKDAFYMVKNLTERMVDET
jgi:ribosomal-protein-alanine N-acetyltransferase